MKKVMFAAVAMTACVGLSEITSQNVVGYQDNAVPKGYSMITPTFKNISTETMPIDGITLKGVTVDGSATAQIVNADGTWADMAVWLNEYVDPQTGEVFPAGWFTDVSGLTPSTIVLKPGQAVFFSCKDDGVSAQTAGEVPGAITLNMPNGYSMLGNGSPVQLEIDDIRLTGVTVDGSATAQIVNADGTWADMAVWLNEYTDPQTGEVFPAGWFTDVSGLTPSTIVLKPGAAVFFSCADDGVQATMPSALK